MDKQINLYANVFAASQKKRAILYAGAALAALSLALGVGSYLHVGSSRSALQAEESRLTSETLREAGLIEIAKKTLVARRASLESGKKDDSAADSSLLSIESVKGHVLADIWDGFIGWDAPGAVISSIVYETGTLTISGQANTAREASFALDDLMVRVARVPGWALKNHEIKAPAPDLPKFIFKLTAIERSNP